MGGSSYDSNDWKAYSTASVTKSRDRIFAQSASSDMSPKDIIREARDNDTFPKSTPIIVALDVTGSMGSIPEYMVKQGMGPMFQEIIDRQPVTNPQICFCAVGDVHCDRHPFQVGQFEGGMAAATWLEKTYLEGGGGGNGSESYHLPYWFAMNHVKADAFDKRNEKGFLFSIGDELPPPSLSAAQIKDVFGTSVPVESAYSFKSIVEKAAECWNFYHIQIVNSYTSSEEKQKWRDVLGERVIFVEDHKTIPELIVSLIQIDTGEDVDVVSASWSGTTAVAIKSATQHLTKQSRSDRDI